MIIAEYLMKFFDSVYCDTCRYVGSDRDCEECHRKAMHWAISQDTAEQIETEINALRV